MNGPVERDAPSRRGNTERPSAEEELGGVGELTEDQLPRGLDGQTASVVVGELTEDRLPYGLDVGTASVKDEAKALSRRRHVVTLVLLALVAAGGLGVYLGAFFGDLGRWSMIERASEIVLVPLLTLLAAAVGWYFSERSHK